MKSNFKLDHQNHIAEISISNVIEPDEQEVHDAYMNECMTNDAMFINTTGMSTSDAKYMCGLQYMKSRMSFSDGADGLTDAQKQLPPAIQKAILKRQHKQGKLSEAGMKEAEALGCWDEMKAEGPASVFIQEPAPASGQITQHLNDEGMVDDEKLKKEQEASRIKNPDLQSPVLEVVES
jgi:hypothetical protein